MARRELKTVLNITHFGVVSVAFTPDGKFLMTGSDQGVALWDTTSWRLQKHFPGELAALAETGNLLATSEASPFYSDPAGVVRLWNWRTGELLYQFQQSGRALALSADGSLLAVAGAENGIAIWATAAHQLLQTVATKDPVWSLCFSPDARRLISTGWSSDASLWDLQVKSPPEMISGHLMHVWSAVFSPDGKTIVTTSSDQTVRLWDATTLQQKSILRGHVSEVWCAAWSPDGKLLATGGKDDKVMLWSSDASPKVELDLPHDMDFRPRFSPDGKRLVTVNPVDGHNMLWNADNGSMIASNLAGGRLIIGFSQDGSCVAEFDSINQALNFWRPKGNDSLSEVVLAGGMPGETQCAYAGMAPAQDYFFAINTNGLIQVWNALTGNLLGKMQGPLPPIRNAVLSAQGKKIAISTERESVARLFDIATGTEHVLAGHHDFVSGLAFSPDGSTLATGSIDGTIRLWDTTSGKITAWLPGHMQETTDVAFSADGLTLASLGREDSLKLWDLRTGREVVSEAEPHAGIWLQFSPDGQKLAVETDNGKVRLLAAPAE